MSLYGDYVKERLGDFILETDYGFATYRYINDKKTVYVVDLFVIPEMRKKGLASDLTDKIVEIAKKEGATELWGTVSPQAVNPTDSIKALLAYGMTFLSSTEQIIIFRKDI